ncbi:DNA-processing protein DprA [Microbacterium lacticum]
MTNTTSRRDVIHELTAETHPDLWGTLALGDDSPERLWVRGNLAALTERPAVAITGARACTAYGEHVAAELARDLTTSHTIITGGSYGIDEAATRSAIHAESAAVIVSACGVDRTYPVGHRELFGRVIEQGGAIVSETAPGEAPTKARFIRRQRLVAGLTRGAVIVEAGARSGSLGVATWARELGRPVGCTPGPLTSAASTGTHLLIRAGAALITSAADIREMIS